MKKSGVVFSLLAFLLFPAISLAGTPGLASLSSQIMGGQTVAALSAMHMSIVDSGGTPTFGWDKTPWRVDQGGTGATSFTNGSLMFYSNGFSQDNANIFWDFANHVLDIGTNASTSLAKLNVKGGPGQGLLNLISSAGASQVFVASNGNVGLNNTNPRHRLDVAGAIYSRLVNVNGGSIDWNAGNIQSLTLVSPSTAVTFVNGQAGGEYKLILNQDTVGGRTVTWPVSVKWAGGIAPALTPGAGSIDIVSFLFDGISYLGSYSNNYTANSNSGATIAFDTAADGGSTTGTSLAWTHITSGLNRFLVVWVDGGVDNDNIIGATYGGISMTLLGKYHTGSGTDRWQYEYYLFNPTLGTNTVIVSSSLSDYIAGLSASYTGTNQSSLDGALMTIGSPNWTNTLTTNCANDWHIGVAGSNNGAVIAGAGTTLRIASSVGDSGGILDNNGSIFLASNNSITANNSGGNGWMMGLVISPVGGCH